MSTIPNSYSEYFTSVDGAVEFMIDESILAPSKDCDKCYSLLGMSLTKLIKNSVVKYKYKCKYSSCRRIISIFREKDFSNNKVQLNKFLYALWLYLLNTKTYIAASLVGLTRPKYSELKKKFLKYINKYMERSNILIGGAGVEVQLDETIITRLFQSSCPSNFEGYGVKSKWLLGGVERYDKNKFFIVVVPDRKVETLAHYIGKFVAPGSKLMVDGYTSYPGAARILNMDLEIVNHSKGFKNEYGNTTNAAEGLWSHLKLEIKSRHGVKLSNMNDFLKEFEFKKKHLDFSNLVSVKKVFIEILKIILNYLVLFIYNPLGYLISSVSF